MLPARALNLGDSFQPHSLSGFTSRAKLRLFDFTNITSRQRISPAVVCSVSALRRGLLIIMVASARVSGQPLFPNATRSLDRCGTRD